MRSMGGDRCKVLRGSAPLAVCIILYLAVMVMANLPVARGIELRLRWWSHDRAGRCHDCLIILFHFTVDIV